MTKQDPYWFFRKWGIEDTSLASRIQELEKRVEHLILENIGTTNALYELENKLDMLSSCQYNMLSSEKMYDV